MTALAKRAVAAGFVWRPGFRCLVEDCPGEVGALCVEVCEGRPTRWFVDGDCVEDEPDDEPPLPDFGHDLTRLGLLALVREAHSDPGLFVVSDRHDRGGERIWYLSTTGGAVCRQYYTREAEALVAALEAAP